MSVAHELAGARVLFVLCNFEMGGAERQALALAAHLKGLGCDVRVWGHHHHQRGPEAVLAWCAQAGIPCAEYRFRWPCRVRDGLRDAARLLRGLRREHPDFILPYTGWPNVGCGLVWRWSPARVCIWGQRDVRLRGDPIERWACRRASAVICNARHVADHVRSVMGAACPRVHVVPNGVAMPPPQRSRYDWRGHLGIGPDETVFTMVANFRTGKDHATVLRAWHTFGAEAMATQRRPRLVLAGAPQETSAAVQQLAAELNLRASVTFAGPVDDVAGLLAASDVGVLASADEGLPNALLEYMAGGLPAIVTDLPGAREALGGAAATFYPAGNVAGLAAALEAVWRDPDKRLRDGEASRARAAADFSMARMCAAMTALLADEGRRVRG